MVVALVVLGGVVVVDHLRAQHTLRRMRELMVAGRHAEVIAHREPPRRYVGVAARLRATSALLTGRYHRCLQLLETPAGAAAPVLAPQDLAMRAMALLGLGRYDEAAAALGDDPVEPLHRHLRAQAAIETGQDWMATRLLADPHPVRVDEAGRRRILGDLHVRRGRPAEGEDLVRSALATYADSSMSAREVDMGYCHAHLASSALARGDVDAALAELGEAERLLLARPDNDPGFLELACIAAEAHAAARNPSAADEHLATARRLAEQVESPAARARVARAAGTVAWTLHRPDARDLLTSALAQHEALGERPAAAEVRRLLASPPPST